MRNTRIPVGPDVCQGSRRRAGLIGTLLAATLLTACSNVPDTKAKLPMGYLESPAPNTVLRGVTMVSGWALSEDGIDKIAVYVDRTFSGYGKVSGLRPDVIKAFPTFTGTSDVQWSAQFDTSSIPVGRHEVLARAISKKGGTRDLGTSPVTVEH